MSFVIDDWPEPDYDGGACAEPLVVPTSLEQLLEILRQVPPDMLCLVGYVNDAGDYAALTAAALRGETK